MKEFDFIWAGNPIDFWENTIIPNNEEYERVMAQMPETPRDNVVLKTYIPADGKLSPVYMCKADNNGTIYFFSDFDFVSYYNHSLELVKKPGWTAWYVK